MSVRLIEVDNPLQEIKDNIEEVEKAFKAVVIQMRNVAVSNVPVDTGDLKASVASHPVETNESNVFQLGSNLEYASFIHDGTHKIPARPFLDHAIDQLESEIANIIADALK